MHSAQARRMAARQWISSARGGRKAISYLCLFCLLFECGVVLAPILKTGYFSDDLINAMENARAHYMGWNAFQYYLQKIYSTIWDGHRVILLAGHLVIPYLVPNLVLYKSMVVAGVTGNVILFAYYLNSVLKTRYFGFLWQGSSRCCSNSGFTMILFCRSIFFCR